ncbi:hypothetical protein M5689_018861 [Euphorbia peplus]|nr:hypothetical protein M5689_018861 [Euphorbia peplus]
MILIDEQENSIHAFVKRPQVDKFKAKLDEGEIYIIKNFKIVNEHPRYKPIDNDNKLLFIQTTHAKLMEESPPNIPLHRFNFVLEDEIQRRSGNNILLTDVIGKLVAKGSKVQVEVNDIPQTKLEIQIKLSSDHIIKATLWNEHATRFEDEFPKEESEAIIVAVVRMIVKKFRGECNLTSNSATLFYFNLETKEAKHLLDRYGVNLIVSDQMEKTTFVIFDNEMKRLLGILAEELLTMQKGDTKIIPANMKEIEGTKLLFFIKVTDHNLIEGSRHYTVTKTFPQEAIRRFMKQEKEQGNNSPESSGSNGKKTRN